MVRGLYVFSLILSIMTSLNAQFSGNLQINARIYDSDSSRGAVGTPFYDQLKSSADSWLNLNYNKDDLAIGLRLDFFNNTDLFSSGTKADNGLGLGAFHIRKKINQLDVYAGYVYDQIGGGTIFRAYEERGLGIDNPLIGVRLKYDFTQNLFIKAFVGKQKNMAAFLSENAPFIPVFNANIKGLSAEGFVPVNNDISLASGLGLLNRTFDESLMNNIASEINADDLEHRFTPKYNTYAFTVYNTIRLKNWSWFVEFSYKTNDAMRLPALVYDEARLVGREGTVLLSSLSYSMKKFGITASVKRTKDFDFRVSPNETLNNGLVHFISPLTRQNAKRLLSRYNAATQYFDEFHFK